MTRKLVRRPLIRTVLMSILLLGACARSAIDTEEDLEEDASPSTADGSAEPKDDASSQEEEDAGMPPPEMDAATPADASTPQDAAQPRTPAGWTRASPTPRGPTVGPPMPPWTRRGT